MRRRPRSPLTACARPAFRKRLAVVLLALSVNVASLVPQAVDPIPGYLQQVDAVNLTGVATDLVTLYGPRREDRFSPYVDGSCTASGLVYPQTTLDMAADYIGNRFLAMGYPASAITFETLPGSAGRNVYVTKTGTTYPGVFIEFSGHYDSVDGSPGGADNASGSTAVIELARVLKDYPSRYSMRFILWAAEEFNQQRNAAYYGSTIHVQQALLRGEQIKAGLVMDHIGWSNPSDPTGYYNEVSYWGDESNRIADLFNSVRGQYGLGLGFGKDQGAQNSDEHSYWNHGQVAVSSGGGWLFNRPNYHTCGDTVANIDFGNVRRVAQQNLAVGLTLDAEPYGATGTVTTLASSPNPSLLGQAVTLTATVTATAGTPTGTVSFRDGAALLGTSSLDGSGTATLSTNVMAGGLHSLTASYSGDASHAGSTSIPLVHTVNQPGGTGPTIASLVPSSAPAGSPGFTLAITGTNFTTGATARWNGADRVTTLVSSTQLSAAIPAADIAVAGTAQVTVFTPGSGGGISNAAAFVISGAPSGSLRAAYGMEEGGGPTVNDMSGNANHGTVSNGAIWVAGRHGLALGFDGVDDYVQVPNSPSIDLSGAALTIEGWVNIAPGAASGLLLAKPWVAGQSTFPYYQYAVAYDAGSNQLNFHYGTSIAGLRSFSITAPGSGWHHVAFTYDGPSSYVRGYLDGAEQLAVQVPFPLEARGTPLLLGVDGALGTPFHGALDEVRIYGVALGAAEIQADMNTPIGGGSTAPSISGFTPASGPVGTAVTITGVGFTGATLVRFNTTDQPAFTILDTTTITTTVPTGATTGPVQVVTAAGTATSATPYTVTTVIPTVSIDSVSTGESGSAAFSVTLSSAATATVTVDYATLDGTATAGSDYTATAGTLTFGPGVTSRTLTVDVLTDVLDELDETFTVGLASPTGATLGTALGTGTIQDDDAPPALSIADAAVTEGNDGSANAVFTVTLSAPSGRTVTAGYQTADASATAGSDYTQTSGTLSFDPGVTVRTLTVPVLGDTQPEGAETFTVTLVSPSGAVLGDGSALGTILDNDSASVLSIGNVTITEGNSGSVNATFTVTLSPPSSLSVVVDYTTGDVTATAGSDYSTRAGSLTFQPGVTSRTLAVPILGDTRDEADETFSVNLSSAVNAVVGTGTGIGTIVDNDSPPSLAIGNVTVTEGNGGTASAVFTVTLSPASGLPVTVDYATADGTASAGIDYVSTAGGLAFAPGTTIQTVVVPVLGDGIDEANETFTVGLSNASGATIGDGSGLGTISDDDARPSLRVTDVTVTEGNSGSVDATFTVTLSAPSGLTVTVAAATVDGTSVAGADYVASSGPLSFPPGITSRTFAVAVLADLLDEPNETFTLRLSSAVNASIADGSGRGTILDDDPVPTLAIADALASESAGTVTFTVTLSAASGRTVSVRYATVNGTATSGSDYTGTSGTLTFVPGTTTASVTVAILNDTIQELSETFTVRLSNASNATIADNTGVATITDND